MDRRNNQKRASCFSHSNLKRARLAPAAPKISSLSSSRLGCSSGPKRKKVKFSVCNHEQILPLNQTEKPQFPVNDARTSEYQFFKKLWDKSSHSPNILPKNNLKMSKEESGLNNFVATSKSDKRSFSPLPIQIQNNLPTEVLEICEEQLNEQPTYSAIDHTPIHKLDTRETLEHRSYVSFSENPQGFDKIGDNCMIFSEKRRKLLKLAANTLSVEIEDFSVKRSYLIGEFLQRLRIETKLERKEKTSSSCREIQFKSELTEILPALTYTDFAPHPSKSNWVTIEDFESYEQSDYSSFDFDFKYKSQSEQSLVPYRNSASFELPSPVKQFDSQLEEETYMPLAIYSGHTREYENFEGYIGKYTPFSSPKRRSGIELEWESSSVCGSERNETSLVLFKRDPMCGIFGFSNIDVQLFGTDFFPENDIF